MPTYLRYTLIALFGCVLFIPFIGQVHLFDWDEINFAECAREMIVTKDYLRAQIDFMPFWEKPPLFIWMQVLAMKAFGIGEFAARFPNALIGVLTLLSLYYIGKRVVNEKMANWWVLLYAATWLPHFYFKSGIIDPTFNFFIFMAFFQVYLVKEAPRKGLHAVLAGLFLGLAVLTKGPVAILIAVLALASYMVINKGLKGYAIKHLLVVALCTTIPILLWLGATAETYGIPYGKWFLNEFIRYQIRLFSTEDADHGGPFFYHFIVLLAGCFPASLFLFQFKRRDNTQTKNYFTQWMWILFWVVLILFSIVQTKIVHYSSLCYFPLTYLGALQLYQLSSGTVVLKKAVKVLLLIIGTLLAVVIGALPLVGIYKQKLIPLIHDPFAVGNLDALVPWSYTECLWGLIYLAVVWISVLMMRKNFRRGMLLLCGFQVLIIQVTVLHFTPKIEAISQRAAIEYFQGFEGKDVYLHSLGYKSYANLFYARKIASTNPKYVGMRVDKSGKEQQPEANADWLLYGDVDKPTYFITKIQDKAKYDAMPQLINIGGSNGFVFYKRK